MGDDTPTRAVTKSDPPDWTWVDKVFSAAEAARLKPISKWRVMLCRSPLPGTAKAVGFYLLAISNRDGCSWRSERTMAAESGWSRSCVRRTIERLEADGWVGRTNVGQGKLARVWLTWPLWFPTGTPELPVGESSDEDDWYSSATSTGVPQETTGVPQTLTGVPQHPTGSSGTPECSLSGKEIGLTSVAALDAARQSLRGRRS